MSGVMINWDDSFYFYSLKNGYGADARTRDEAISYARAAMEQYAGTPVTDVMLCVCARLASFPSKIWETYGNKYRQASENGHSVDYSDTWAASYHEIFEKWNFDIFQIWLDFLRQMNISSWMSVRMNDAHELYSETSMLAPDFYYNNPQLRRFVHRQNNDYFAPLYNYALPEVRRRFLDFIEEILGRYDSDGIELDFLREAYLFAPGGEYNGIKIMNDFMREVRRIADVTEVMRGHKIKIAVRTTASPETALYLGFDVAYWASEGLVDTVIPSPRFSVTDTDMPVELWKRLLAPYAAELAAGVEIIIKEQPSAINTFNTVETLTAAAASYFSAGADKFYLFNYFHVPGTSGDSLNHNPLDDRNYRDFLFKIGSKEAAVSNPRSHLITYRGSDALSFWESTNAQLPRHITRGSWAMFRIRTGEILPDSSVSLIIGFESADETEPDLTVFINTAALIIKKRYDGLNDFTSLPLYELPLTDVTVLSQVNTIEVSSSADIIVGYIEIKVN
ncbi:MAG: hypothetical protein ACYCWE_17695 [Eubacteriales bacterium]